MRHIKPKQNPGRPGFRVTFRNPRKNNEVVTAGIGRDENVAKVICRDLEALSNEQKFWTLNPESPELAGFHPRAREIFYGVKLDRETHSFDEWATPSFDFDNVEPTDDGQRLQVVYARKLRELLDKYEPIENELKVLRPENEELRQENARLRRQLNLDVKDSIGKAQDLWETNYAVGKASVTVQQAKRAVKVFIDSLPKKRDTKLATVRARDIDDWVTKFKLEDGTDPSPITMKKLRAYVSAFFSWAVRRYDLSENPMDRTGKIAGVDRFPENILAIRRLQEIHRFSKCVGAVPILAGMGCRCDFCGPTLVGTSISSVGRCLRR